MIKVISYQYLLFLLFLFSLTGCFTEPEYPDTPSIEFTRIENYQSREFPNQDSVLITVSFKDGDGDLGLSSSDTIAPFQILLPSGEPNRFHFNYFVEVEKQNETGEFELVVFGNQSFTLNGRFPRLNTLDKETALEGDLRFSFLLFVGSFSPIQRGDVLRYKVQIVDRNLNESNMIETESMAVGVYEEE